MSKEHSLYHHFLLFLKNKFSRSPFKISFLDEKILKLGTKGKLQSRTLLGKKVYFKDGYSYLSSINEVFVNHCYKFVSDIPKPIIIDCGANIGISVIYFSVDSKTRLRDLTLIFLLFLSIRRTVE